MTRSSLLRACLTAAFALVVVSSHAHAALVNLGPSTSFAAAPIIIPVVAEDGSMFDMQLRYNAGTTTSGGTFADAATGNSTAPSPFNGSNVASWSWTGESAFLHTQTPSIEVDFFASGTSNPLNVTAELLVHTEFSSNSLQVTAKNGTVENLDAGTSGWTGLGTSIANFDNISFAGFSLEQNSSNPEVVGEGFIFEAPDYGTFSSSGHGFQVRAISSAPPLASAVPEPSQLILFFVVIGIVMRRPKR